MVQLDVRTLVVVLLPVGHDYYSYYFHGTHLYLHLVQCCTLYSNATHIANIRYRTTLAKNGRIGYALVTIK